VDTDQAEAAVGRGVGDGQDGDLRGAVFHDARGFAERHRRVGAHGVDRHDVGGAGRIDVDAAAEGATKVAVGDETGERTVGGEHAGGAVRVTGHRDDRIAKGVAGLGAGAGRDQAQARLTGKTEDFRLVHFDATSQARPGDFVDLEITDASAHYLIAKELAHIKTRGGDVHEARTKQGPAATSLGIPTLRKPSAAE